MPLMWGRLIRRTVAVGVCLGVMGYLLAQVFLVMYRTQSGPGYNPENERVLWQTPLVMSLLGMAFTGGTELLIGLCRKPATVAVKSKSE